MKKTSRTKFLFLAGAAYVARAKMLRWGATDAEVSASLPGDEVVENANLVATRAITIEASADVTWQWLVQIGQERGGFYSYEWLENLVGCDIHTAHEINPVWQTLEPGDEVRLHPKGGLIVASIERGRSLVLAGGVPKRNSAPPPYDFSWAFVLEEEGDGTTRLIVRERYGYQKWWTGVLVEPLAAMSFVMSEKMLRGIRDRAEQTNRS